MGYKPPSLRGEPKTRRGNLRQTRRLLRAILTLIAIAVLLIASCTPATQQAVAGPLPTSTSTPLAVTIPEATPTVISPSPTVTATQVTCDPFTADFCITDGHFLFQNPILPSDAASVDRTYRYGSTQNGTRDPHHGVEIGKGFGTPVHAAGEGVVQFAGPDDDARFSPWRGFYGNVVVIRHADGLYTLYGHLSKIEVQTGESVAAGQKIGEMGQSGAATGTHLHFEVRRGDAEDYFSTQNPELWLLPNQTDFGAMALSVVNGNSEFQGAAITIQRIDEANNIVAAYYVDTYHPSLAVGDENAAFGDTPAGRYRISLIFNGHFYERWAEVQSGKLTQVVIVVE